MSRRWLASGGPAPPGASVPTVIGIWRCRDARSAIADRRWHPADVRRDVVPLHRRTSTYHARVERLTPALALAMARLAIENIGREYPNAPGHLLRSADDLRPPRELHPAFFGSWDWHSSVHQHWLLVRLLRLGRVRQRTDARARRLPHTLTADNLAPRPPTCETTRLRADLRLGLAARCRRACFMGRC